MKPIVSGSLAYDRIMDFPGKFEDHILPEKIHILNVCFTVNGLTEKFGGTAGNIAYSLGLLGEKPLILATAGKDFDRYRQWLEQNDLPLSGIRSIPEVFTASAYITTDKSDNQITGFNPGAMGYPSEYNLGCLQPADTLAIISPGNLDDMLTYSREYKKRGIDYIFDPGQSIPALSGDALVEMINGSKLLVCNDYELEMIKKSTGLDNGSLLEQTAAVIVTMGEKGSVVFLPDRQATIAPADCRTVADPTGAGDAYRSGLIKGFLMGKDVVASAEMGSTCASFAVECLGTQEHCFTEAQFWSRHRSNYGD